MDSDRSAPVLPLKEDCKQFFSQQSVKAIHSAAQDTQLLGGHGYMTS